MTQKQIDQLNSTLNRLNKSTLTLMTLLEAAPQEIKQDRLINDTFHAAIEQAKNSSYHTRILIEKLDKKP